MQANLYVGTYGIEPQGKNESDSQFKSRVAGILRDNGLIVEAHEVTQDARWDDPDKGDSVMDGILGAMAQSLQGVDYNVSGDSQVGADIAAGIFMKSPKKDDSDLGLLLMMALMGKK